MQAVLALPRAACNLLLDKVSRGVEALQPDPAQGACASRLPRLALPASQAANQLKLVLLGEQPCPPMLPCTILPPISTVPPSLLSFRLPLPSASTLSLYSQPPLNMNRYSLASSASWPPPVLDKSVCELTEHITRFVGSWRTISYVRDGSQLHEVSRIVFGLLRNCTDNLVKVGLTPIPACLQHSQGVQQLQPASSA